MQDVRYSLRTLRKSPDFTAVAALTLALGIGANTAIFSVVNMFLFRPLPVEKPNELASIFAGDRLRFHSYPDYIDLRDYNNVFAGLAAHKIATVAISDEERPSKVSDQHPDAIRGEIVSGNYFDVLGVRTVLGRSFTPEEDRAPNARPVVVLSHGLWERRFHSDPKVVGRDIYLNSQSFTVIGVAPPTFMEIIGIARDGHFEEPSPSLIIPFLQAERSTQMTLLVRVTSANDFKSIAEDIRREARKLDSRTPVFQMKLGEDHIRGVFRTLRFFAGVTSTLAAIALALASLGLYGVMAYTVSLRTKEIGIRMAFGAQPGDVLRLILRQGMLLTSIGLTLGLGASLALTRAGMNTLYGMSTTDLSTYIVIVLPLTSVALLVCWIPARRATKVDPMITLKYE